MAVQNRTALIEKTYKALRKYYKPVESTLKRSVLEHLLYALVLENTPFDLAEKSFERIRDVSYDWNEVRVSSVAELAELMSGIADARQSAANLKRILHSVFESQYSFELDHFHKENIGKAATDLGKHQGCTPFAVSYVVQHALDGHAIPLDKGALDVLYIVGIIDEKERQSGVAPGLDRAIPKKKGIEFFSLLHQLGADLFAGPFSKKVRDILLEINPDGKDRLPKRIVKKPEPEPAPLPPPPPPVSRDKGVPTSKKDGSKQPIKEKEKGVTKAVAKPAAMKTPPPKKRPLPETKGRTAPPQQPPSKKAPGKTPEKKGKPVKFEGKKPTAGKRPPAKPTRPAKAPTPTKSSPSKQLARKKPK
jgi:endonuclease III